MTRQVILYLPVLHAGYIEFLTHYQDADEVLVIGRSFQQVLPQLRKDIRAVEPQDAVLMVQSLIPGINARVVELEEISGAVNASVLIMPDEDLMHELSIICDFSKERIFFDPMTFLRWDRSRAEAEREVKPDEVISEDQLHLKLAGMASAEAEKSPDWWRQVGAVAWKDGRILYADHNRHLPTDYTAVIEGDPRGNYRGGVRTDLSLALHAEPGIVGRAAREGVSLDGATLVVNTFPCPSCARLIVAAGFSEIVYQTGYVLLEGDDLLRQAGIKITRVLPN